jgi:hypothetical protein
MKQTILTGSILILFSGCAVRDASMYRDDTRKLLETKEPVLRQCYDAELQKDPKAAGKVIVSFTVQQDTGVLIDPKLDDLQSTPNRELRRCVMDALKGLTLDPADERDGEATFTWDFQTKS